MYSVGSPGAGPIKHILKDTFTQEPIWNHFGAAQWRLACSMCQIRSAEWAVILLI